MSDVDILPMGPHEFAVTVREGATETQHHVRVPEDLPADVGRLDVEEQALVRESFAFLLEREKAASILHDFSLDEISRYYPDYLDELRARIG